MNRLTDRRRRAPLTLLAAMLCVMASPVATPTAAATEAATRGQVCIFLAPNDVDPDGRGPRPPMGHNGWGFRHGTSDL